jgi:glycosyltransferase involved in cell wall biosynthesis
MPLISVIIPVYNGEKTIRETIESVLKQTFSDWELIIINDGSQDSTLEIVFSIQDTRLKVFSYPNAGLAASRNRGIAQASGEYISFIDADDLWTTDKLEAQLQVLQANPQAAVAYSWTKCIDEFGQVSRRGTQISVRGDVYKNLLVVNFLENGSNLLIRRQALNEVGSFDESINIVADWDMWLRLAARYHFEAVSSPQILYRVSASSMSANVLRMEAESLQVIERAFTQAPESVEHLKKYSLGNTYKYLTYKAIEGPPERKKGLVAARFLWQAVRNDPALLRTKVLFKVLFKIAAITILPPQQAQLFFTRFKKLTNTTTMLGYLQLDPF